MRIHVCLIGFCMWAGAAGAASAASLAVRVVDDHGKAVADAVVTATPKDASASPAPFAPTTKYIDQKDLMFVPYLETFRPGDKVVFRNSDKTRHHVYSFSPTRSFQFILVPGESSPALTFDKTGVVAVGCNIHDQMIAYLYVSDARWLLHSGADGQVVFRDLPAGAYDIHVWQPRLRANASPPGQTANLAAGSDARAMSFKLTLLPDTRHDSDREHMRY